MTEIQRAMIISEMRMAPVASTHHAPVFTAERIKRLQL
jgi:hypothetical protein